MALDLAAYSLNPYALPTFVTAGAVLLLGIVLLVRERASRVSLLFFLVTLSISVWLFAFSWMYCATTERAALWWAKVAYLGVPFIPASIYHFTVAVLSLYPQQKPLVWTGWALSGGFAAAILLTDTLISGLYRYWWGSYPRYGWLSVPYLSFFFGWMLMSLRHYWREYRKARPGTTHQRRVRTLMVAFAIAFLGSFDYLAKYGVPLYPFGYLPVIGFLVITARKIWRYRLADLTPAFAATQILKTMLDPLLVVDREGIVRVANQAACLLFGAAAAELIGKPLSVLCCDILPAETRATLLHEGGILRYEVTCGALGRRDAITLEISTSVLRDRSRQAVGLVCIAKDITERTQVEETLKTLNETLERRVAERSAAAEQRTQELTRTNAELDVVMQELRTANARLTQLTLLDPLTELLNRRGLQEALSRELRLAKREGSTPLALLVDLDDFKQINDTLGYAVGDVVLKEIARKLRASVRTTDHVGRIGGDEFMVLLPRTRPAEGLRVAQKARLGLSGAPIPISPAETVRVTGSLGLVAASPATPSLDEVVSQAHVALYRSKQAGKNQVFYDRNNLRGSQGEEATVLDVLTALRSGTRFHAVMQPIVRLTDRRKVGYEFLSRLAIEDFEHPEHFFPVALEANMLTLVDHQCFKTCLAAASPLPLGIRRHVNLFPSTMLNLPVQDLLEAFHAGSPLGAYCIELSEQQIIGDPSYLARPVETFKQAGVSIALDDVGFGRSSLESLILLEPHLIKIDKRCVQGAAQDRSRAHSLKRLLAIARALGTDVVAEGIESQEDLNILDDLGVPYGQGFLLGAPIEPSTAGLWETAEALPGVGQVR